MSRSSRSNTLIASIIGALFALVTYYLLTEITINTVSRVLVQGMFPVGTVMHVELLGKAGTELVDSVDLQDSKAEQVVLGGTRRLNFPAEKITLRFDTGPVGEDGARAFLNIYNIQFLLPYSDDIFIGQDYLREYFSSEQFVEGEAPFIEIQPDALTAQMSLIKPIVKKKTIAYIFLSLTIGAAIFLVVRNSNWASIPAFQDLSLGNKISTTHEFNMVNGLRGVAAIFVLLSHTAPGFYALQLGISLLFVFSGFLLAKPFVRDSSRIFNWENIQRYLTKRLKRILPVYYLYVFIMYVVSFQFDTAMRHFLFVESNGHLWPMTQIFTFYMLLPLVLVLTSLAYKLHKLLPVALLSIAIYLWLKYSTGWRPYYNGRFSNEFFLYAFLTGVLGSYVQYEGHRLWSSIREFISTNSAFFAVFAGLLSILTVAWSAPVTPPAIVQPYIAQFYVKCILSLSIIILALNIRGTWFNAVVSNVLFRSVGVVGFSFYILHGLGMQIVQQFQMQFLGIAEPPERSWLFFVTAFVVTYVMALISYSYVERPFFGYREQPATGQA